MGRRSRRSALEALIEALALLPWQVCLSLAPTAYILGRWGASVSPPKATNVAQLGDVVQSSIIRTGGIILEWLGPAVFLLAAAMSYFARRSRARLLEQTLNTGGELLQKLSWQEFEHLVAGHFEAKGYQVAVAKPGPDGGVDITARKGKELFLVQCKQWRATQIGVQVVRELFGIMVASGATGAYVVSTGPFTSDAKSFAHGRNIHLFDARQLLNVPSSPSRETMTEACPRCGAPMVKRVARQGRNAGKEFLGCSTYPRCRGTIELTDTEKNV